MEPPYDSKCRNYTGEYIKAMADLYYSWGAMSPAPAMDMNVPTSRESCIDLCLAQAAADKCHCWPRVLPLMKNNMTVNVGELKMCPIKGKC